MHASVVVLFSVAIFFYLLGAITPAIIFSFLGAMVEIAAWLTLFGTSSSENGSKEPEKLKAPEPRHE
jgi:hypothetical protein